MGLYQWLEGAGMSNKSVCMLTHLLACLGEEAGEIQQAAGKDIRFGLLDRHPTQHESNWVRLRLEVHDLVAVYEVLCDKFDRDETLDRRLIEAKKAKIAKWMEVSKSLGLLSKDTPNG